MKLTKNLMLIPATAVALGITLGAGQRQSPPGPVAEQNTTKQTQKPAKPTGIAECDRYFAMVDACVATKKMSKEDQKAAEFSVERLRTMLPIARAPQGRETLVQRCTASLEAARKDDKYGCYKSDDKAGGRQD